MENKTEYIVLEEELALIGDLDVQAWTVLSLKQAPGYFWYAPASMTGKYHPVCSNGKAGLIIHTKRVVYFADKICFAWGIINQNRDIVLSACILHDIAKPMPGQSYQLHTNHPINALAYLAKGDSYFIKTVKECIQWHMGRFSPRSIVKAMGDFTLLELTVYTADYLSSRKNLATPRDTDICEAIKD